MFYSKDIKKEQMIWRNLFCKCLSSRCSKCNNEGHKPVKCKFLELFKTFSEGKAIDDTCN